MKKLEQFLIVVALSLLAASTLTATPSTQIWNPSTDIQPLNTFHLGIDNYYSVANNASKPYAAPTDIGLTTGVLIPNLEFGMDALEPATDPIFFNAKLGLAENGVWPALAIGAQDFGTNENKTGYNIGYALVAKNAGSLGRVSLGGYYGNDQLLMDENGNKANTGLIASWDKNITDKVWLSVDYASGQSFYGELSFGGSYNFSANTSVLFGYVIYNNTTLNPNNQVTTQLDINI